MIDLQPQVRMSGRHRHQRCLWLLVLAETHTPSPPPAYTRKRTHTRMHMPLHIAPCTKLYLLLCMRWHLSVLPHSILSAVTLLSAGVDGLSP